MATTIQVRNLTLDKLLSLKTKYKLKSYDELLNRLISIEKNIPKSKFGVHPEMKSFTKKDEIDFHEL